MIRKCADKDIDPKRPKSEQVWCLYTHDGSRVLGRHPSEESAYKQESAIKARGGSLLEDLDRLAAECDAAGLPKLAARIDRIAVLMMGTGVTGPEPGGPPTSTDLPAEGQEPIPPAILLKKKQVPFQR